MAETILRLNNLSKVYVLGIKRNARKANRAIHKLHKEYERACEAKNKKCIAGNEKKLGKAQELFAQEKYEESYRAITGKKLKQRGKDRGVVVHALDRINLEIKAGDLVAIMGPSGCGKSTLLNMLGLLDEPTAGQIFIKDENISGIKVSRLPHIRSTELGFVFQSFNLIPTLTAIENVMLPLKYAGHSYVTRKKMATESLEKVGLGDRLNHSPNELSGGQIQRVAIARSIVGNPAVILGDELTGELDTKMTREVMDLISELNKKGQTFIIVTHNPEVAEYCSRVIYMRDGKIEKEIRRKK